MNYSEIVNRVLVRLNEPTLSTSSTSWTTDDRGIQTQAKNAVNESIQDIINAEKEWPFNYTAGTQTLTPGVQEYALPTGYTSVDWDSFYIQPINHVTNGDFTSAITSWTDASAGTGTAVHSTDGDGRARLTGDGTNAGAIEQALTTVKNRVYKVYFAHYGTDVALRVGTSTGGTQIHSETLSLTDTGEGEFKSVQVTATSTTTYVGFYNTSTVVADVDAVQVREDLDGRALVLSNFDEWRKTKKRWDNTLDQSKLGYPYLVYPTQNDKFGVRYVPDQSNYQVSFDYWDSPSDLSASTDTTVIPTEFQHIIIGRAESYCHNLRSDPAFSDRANKQFDKGVQDMRVRLIDKPDRAVSKGPTSSMYSNTRFVTHG